MTVLSLVLGAVAFLPLPSDLSRLAAALAVFVLIVVLTVHFRPWIAGHRAGVTGFWPERQEHGTRDFLRSVQNEYRFFGLFYREHAADLKSWRENDRKGNVHVKMLLIEPDPTSNGPLAISLRHSDWMNPAQSRDLDTYLRRCENTLRDLRELRRGGLSVEVRHHREPVRFKMHISDGERVWLQMPRKGRHPSNPAHLTIEQKTQGGLFDYYSAFFDSVWECATPVDLDAKAKDVGA